MPLSARLLSAALVLGLSSLSACAGDESRFDRSELERGDAGLILGEFPLKQDAIVDGDTIKVDGLDASLRLLGIDTEETFKSNKAWREFEAGWERYLERKQSQTSRPIKVPTPLGEDAKHWAQDFFMGVTAVRLERDHPKLIRGAYNRFLAYVFVEIEGEWLNYNVEAVRAGMSPYFMKYGYSRRFHEEFVAAEREAREAERGIWAKGAQCYQDYELRERWWTGRAEFVKQFEAEAEQDPSLIMLTHWDAMARIERRLGDEVELLATVGDIRQGERGPKRVLLSRRMFQDFPLIFWEDDVFEESGIERYRSEYVRVRGVVTSYTDRRSGRRQLQIEVRDPIQVRLPEYEPPGKAEDAGEDPEFDKAEDPSSVEAPADFSPAPTTPAPEPSAPAEPPAAEVPLEASPPASEDGAVDPTEGSTTPTDPT